MTTQRQVLMVPEGAPKAGEVFKHYKGDHYRVVSVALGSGDAYSDKDEWMVVYEAMYENPAAAFFTRPLHEWNKLVDWQGAQVRRFAKEV